MLDFPVGPAWVISASYAASEGKGIATNDANGWGIGATYTLSKRTFLYGGYNYEHVLRMKTDPMPNRQILPLACNTASDLTLAQAS